MSLKHTFIIKEAQGPLEPGKHKDIAQQHSQEVGGEPSLSNEASHQSKVMQCIENVIQARGPRDSGALGHRIDELEVAYDEWTNSRYESEVDENTPTTSDCDVCDGPFPSPSAGDTGAP